MTLGGARTWTEVTDAIVRKFEVAAALDRSTVFNATGSRAMAKLIKTMAAKLDIAVEREKRSAQGDA